MAKRLGAGAASWPGPGGPAGDKGSYVWLPWQEPRKLWILAEEAGTQYCSSMGEASSSPASGGGFEAHGRGSGGWGPSAPLMGGRKLRTCRVDPPPSPIHEDRGHREAGVRAVDDATAHCHLAGASVTPLPQLDGIQRRPQDEPASLLAAYAPSVCFLCSCWVRARGSERQTGGRMTEAP